MRRTGLLGAASLRLEAPGHPLHTMAIMVLDPATRARRILDTGDCRRRRRFIASRLPGIPALRQRLVPAPLVPLSAPVCREWPEVAVRGDVRLLAWFACVIGCAHSHDRGGWPVRTALAWRAARRPLR